ncbi:MAG TPA: S8/S53 family peptidase [Acidimicrobiales bacterium]|nr:S8/S53 family peptidase [Acidimicrobiales bacterium]
MRRTLCALLALACAGLPAIAMHPAAAAASVPFITDPAGDGNGFILEGILPLPNEPALDIRSADLNVTSTTLTATVKVADLATPPVLAAGIAFRWDFSYAGRSYELLADKSASGETSIAFSDGGNLGPCAACTTTFDTAADTVTMRLPMSVLNGRVATPIRGGSKLYQLAAIAQREFVDFTATADTADTDLPYTVPGAASSSPSPTFAGKDERGDAVVIAVIDVNLVPYHWDFDWAHMPQQLDRDKSNDLPLNTPPNKWLPGFPNPSTFKSFQPLSIHQAPTAPQADIATLDAADTKSWDKVKSSTPDAVNYYWLPGTKVIGAVDFNTNGKIHGTTADHGVGTTSVSVGNLHGTCPECLLVFINTDASSNVEAALAWATQQPWIDVITNSYTLNIFADDLDVPVDDNVHVVGPVAAETRAASLRGQTLFFAAGNGLENGFVLPNNTYTSSLSGPDWVVTVGATTPGLDDESGAGKPSDVAGVGESYPAAYTSTHVGGTGPSGFSGTSNATPTLAGTFGRALYQARRLLPGPSRTQQGGVIGRANKPVACGKARPRCELGDGVLTAAELRDRLFLGAVHRNGDVAVGGLLPLPKPSAEVEYADVGHGVYAARVERNDAIWMAEVERIVGPLIGRAPALARPAGERDWMVVDSYCRQQLWGAWTGGYYATGVTLPAPDPAWPLRTALASACAASPSLPLD